MAATIKATISRQDLQENNAPAATITDVKHLASYSWIEAPIPTISVPGIPPRWSPPRSDWRLPKDSGLVYIAQNAARHPENPLEPLFRALYITNPQFDVRSIDIVTDRNNIRKLLSFVDPSSSRNGLEAFTINVEATGNTVIFSREETATKEIIQPHEFKGFGHEFEKAYTKYQISDSTGHHRIVSYRFGGLTFIVRYEVDGYLEGNSGAASSSKELEPDGLSGLLGSLSLSSSSSRRKATIPAGSKMAILQEGHTVPLESVLEIKTRVAHKPLMLSEVAPQLWVSQTPKLVRAYHRGGLFQRPQVEDVMGEIRIWEQRQQKNLKELAALVKKIVAVVKGHGGSATIKYDSIRDALIVTKANNKPMLPKDLYTKWDDKKESEVTGQ
ncbi:hypothetical protein F5X99DRAFT_374309 [Biscogniauxia marginata]|nr:hypothetical protein F5X99DRAFT_374309 [Biscogniauxia marginata]